MPASLRIHVPLPVQEQNEEIRFFDAETWDVQTEHQLMQKIQEIFSLTRARGLSVDFHVTIQSTEPSETLFHLKKKSGNDVRINNYKLSVREIEVLGLIMQGLTNNEVAEKLFISYETVKSHRKNILEKTGARNTAALINYYHQTFFDK